ncbi:MAG TPA: glycosyltransferase [Ktedonobacteraceae bacterium]|nr:glycosyltransferase [Ktedonobacteraceae bacterium]
MQTDVERTALQQGQSLPAQSTDEHFERRVASYRKWLAAQRQQYSNHVEHQMYDYAARAMQAVEVGDSRIQTFAPFRYKYSALQTITRKQTLFLVTLAVICTGCLLWNWKETVAALISLITIGYLSHLVLDVFLALRVIRQSSEERIDDAVIAALKDADWPTYTILCPLYKEAAIVPQFVQAMQAIDYPTDKLQILFLTEEDDMETRRAIFALHLPPHFNIVTVPDGSPRTKPRACNYGLVEAIGQYVVIYDAEDMPDPLQLKKAVLTFANHGPDLACVQAKLNFYNPQQNLLTRWFTAEYSLWFDLILPGLQKAKLAIPLGGTSNHFPTQALRALGGWDAFNVTEDCDLGLRLSWFRLKTVVVDSTTYEEANSRVKNWIRQRSRWIKGYMQTYLVHMREPLHYLRARRLRELFSLQVVIGGKTAILLINPLMWILLALSIPFHRQIASTFLALFPTFILYIGVVTLILGNFFYGYIYLLGCMKREQFELVKWMLLIPAYWVLTSVAACMALYELFTRPHYWQKTIHGLHLKQTQVAPTIDLEWEKLAHMAEELTPLKTATRPTLLHGFGPQVHKYAKLDQVPVASVQDSVETMIDLHKPALPPSERAYLQQSTRTKRDTWFIVTFLTALFLSMAACAYFFTQNQILLFPNAMQQVDMARRFVLGPPLLNLARLGDTNLPLPVLLIAPFAWNNYLWHTGLAGSIVSMLSFVGTALYLFLSLRLLAHRSIIGYLGALLFMLNPTILYLQSTPASTLLCIATLTMSSYYMLAWIHSDRLAHLLAAAGGLCLATLTRYDSWLHFAVFFALILLVGLAKHQKRARIASNLLVFSILGALGIGLWLACCWIISGNPLSFLRARFLSQAALLAPSHTLSTSSAIWSPLYFFGMVALQTLGPVLSIAALAAIVSFLLHRRFKPPMLAALVLLVPIVLYVVAMYNSQLLLTLPFSLPINIQSQQFNACLGAGLVVPAATFIGTLVGDWLQVPNQRSKRL